MHWLTEKTDSLLTWDKCYGRRNHFGKKCPKTFIVPSVWLFLLHLCNVDVDYYAIFEIYGNEQRWTQEIITKLKHQFFMLLQYKDRVEDLPLSSKAECSAGRRTNFYTSKIKLFNNLHICKSMILWSNQNHGWRQ